MAGVPNRPCFPFDFAHHEIARLEPPIDVPLGRLVAGSKSIALRASLQLDRKLVLLGEMADAAEVEHHDRLQRVLPRHAERAVIDHLHQGKKSHHGRDEQDRRPLQRHPDGQMM